MGFDYSAFRHYFTMNFNAKAGDLVFYDGPNPSSNWGFNAKEPAKRKFQTEQSCGLIVKGPYMHKEQAEHLAYAGITPRPADYDVDILVEEQIITLPATWVKIKE